MLSGVLLTDGRAGEQSLNCLSLGCLLVLVHFSTISNDLFFF
jgi:hypothetical protein